MKAMKQWVALLSCMMCAGVSAQSRQVVCDRGNGHFEASPRAGVTMRVGAVSGGGFATRACQASLISGNDRVVAVRSAAQVDIDVFGADLGFGVPVTALEVRQAKEDWRASYQIWSLDRRPRLLWTLSGGDAYRAVDANFNRQVAIWTTDAAAVEGFDGFTYVDYLFPPAVVLQFEGGRMVDVGAWYREQYDRQIATLRGNLTEADLAEFRKSDGQLKEGSVPTLEWVRLRKTKATVLEMVWAYLYSGRPEQAWAELASAWPGDDVVRVKAAIVAARVNGIEAQVTRVASAKLSPKWLERPLVYEYLKPSASEERITGALTYGAMGTAGPGAVMVKQQGSDPEVYEADTEPKPILLWRPSSVAAEQGLAQREETVLLTIDQAGKVESAKMVGPGDDQELLQSAKEWKFIPAVRNRKPVAYKLKMDVGLLR